MHIMPVSGVSQNAPRPIQLNAVAESPRPRSSRAAATPPIKTGSIPEHDPTLLVAALEDIESKRLAIESLVDAGLLCRHPHTVPSSRWSTLPLSFLTYKAC
jgi:hypothetical protein